LPHELSQDELQKRVHYDPETGKFTWLPSAGPHGGHAGCEAGTLTSGGYIQIGMNYKSMLAHRLAWLYMTGSWPDCQIDHIDGNRTNNRFSNLRSVNRQQNVLNSLRKSTTSPYPGVSRPRNGRFRAMIKSGDKSRVIGYSDSEKEAYALYLMDFAEHHGEEAANILHNRVLAAVH
jgi:hypothetical protein